MFGMCSVWDPEKIFLIYKFSYLLFSNSNHKTKTETAIRWETRRAKASWSQFALATAYYLINKPPGPIIMIRQ
jgi:hypothetical protein